MYNEEIIGSSGKWMQVVRNAVSNLVFAIIFAVLGAALLARAVQAHRQAKPEIEAGLLKMAFLILVASAVSLFFHFI